LFLFFFFFFFFYSRFYGTSVAGETFIPKGLGSDGNNNGYGFSRQPSPSDSDPNAKTLWIGKLEPSTGISNDELRSALQALGPLIQLTISERSSSAFAEYAGHYEALHALDTLFSGGNNGLKIRNHILPVGWARPKTGTNGQEHSHGYGTSSGSVSNVSVSDSTGKTNTETPILSPEMQQQFAMQQQYMMAMQQMMMMQMMNNANVFTPMSIPPMGMIPPMNIPTPVPSISTSTNVNDNMNIPKSQITLNENKDESTKVPDNNVPTSNEVLPNEVVETPEIPETASVPESSIMNSEGAETISVEEAEVDEESTSFFGTSIAPWANMITTTTSISTEHKEKNDGKRIGTGGPIRHTGIDAARTSRRHVANPLGKTN
jgi:hypothetical protein